MNTEDRKAALALVRKAWANLPTLSGKWWGNVNDKLLALCVANEAAHRKGNAGRRYPASVTDTAKFQAVKWMAQQLTEPQALTWDEFLDRPEAWLTTRALLERNKKDIHAAWLEAGLYPKALAALDYADFIKED